MTMLNERNREKPKNNKWLLIAGGVLLLFCFYLMLSKYLQSMRHDQEIQDMQEKTEELVLLNSQKQLSLMVKTFVWAVRSAQIRDNLDEVDQYFNLFVKEPKVREVILANNDGKILVASNKKHEGKAFGDLFPAQILRYTDVSFSKQDSVYQISAPVMAFNNKLGTLFILYDAP